MKRLVLILSMLTLAKGAIAQNVGGSILQNSANGHFYQRFLNADQFLGTWQDAQDFAVSLGGNLVSITSQAEQDFIATNYRYYPSKNGLGLLLGGRLVNGNWTWSDGSPWSYTSWLPHMPDLWGGQDVVHYIGNDGEGWNGNTGWDDYWGDPAAGLANFGMAGYAGFIVEWTTDPRDHGTVAVPEPSGWAAASLFGVGFIGILARRHRKPLVS